MAEQPKPFGHLFREAEVFPFPADRIVREVRDGLVRDQVAVSYRGETVVYGSPYQLRSAILEQCEPLIALRVRRAERKAVRRTLIAFKAYVRDRLRWRRQQLAARLRLGLTLAALAGGAAGAAMLALGAMHARGWL